MNYLINPTAFASGFMVPTEIVKSHLKLASPLQLKALLYILCNIATHPDTAEISGFLGVPQNEIDDALAYWISAGILNNEGPQELKAKLPVSAAPVLKKPTREEIIRRGAEDNQIRLLLNEAQLRFGRPLRQNESSILVWLFDDHGMDISLILMLLEYAKSEDKCSSAFIEKTAVNWIKNGIADIASAEKFIMAEHRKRLAWRVVESAFGLEPRQASERELSLSEKWINEWGLSKEVLKLAYDRCVDSKSKFDMRYTEKIIENWHKKGLTTPENIATEDTPPKKRAPKNSFSSSDMSDIDALLSIGYKED